MLPLLQAACHNNTARCSQCCANSPWLYSIYSTRCMTDHTSLCVQEQVPWTALQYVTGQIVYGGRVTDDNDRVLLTQLCQRCYQPQALQPGFAFMPAAALTAPPPDADLPACLDHIQALPAQDSAPFFGMHPNADTAYQVQVRLTCYWATLPLTVLSCLRGVCNTPA